MKSVPESDKKWEAESDARTLADAEAIKMDKARFKRARDAAKRLSTEKNREAMGMERVAKSGTKTLKLLLKNSKSK